MKTKYLHDYHIHTEYSFDCHVSMNSYCKKAVELGLNEICFTDHIDLFYDRKPVGADAEKLVVNESGKMKLTYIDDCRQIINFDFNERQREIGLLMAQYPQLRIVSGVEIGLAPGMDLFFDRYIKDYHFDYILASQHLINGQDPYCGGFFNDRSKDEAYQEYLMEMYANLKKFDDFCCVGHIGYPARFCSEEDSRLHIKNHIDIIDETLKLLIEKGHGIEVNTVGYKNTGDWFPPYSIIQRFYQLTGEVITIGSDCHSLDRLGQYNEVALQMVEAAGFKYLTSFYNKKPQYVKI
ncbi:MAG: histidinol-phosphatase HisJ family protein [Eubacteriales bacterium]|nr:histidinol-phosphatase HisJ family protein [Eubacteriales bacterium]